MNDLIDRLEAQHGNCDAIGPDVIFETAQALRRLSCEGAVMREALEKLARLGNEPRYGNSDGNTIAQEALKKLEPVSEEPAQNPICRDCGKSVSVIQVAATKDGKPICLDCFYVDKNEPV